MQKMQQKSNKSKEFVSSSEKIVIDTQKCLQEYIKKQQKWQMQKNNYEKSITLLNMELAKTKHQNFQLVKKLKQNHKRISTSSYPQQRTFIFNQTNISSLQCYPSIKTPKNIASQQTLNFNHGWSLKLSVKLHLDSIRAICWVSTDIQTHNKEKAFFQNYQKKRSLPLISGSDDCLLKIYKQKQIKFTVRQHMGPIYTIIPTSLGFITAGAQGVVRNWNYQNQQKIPYLLAQQDFHQDSIWQIKLQNSLLLTSSADNFHKIIKIHQDQMNQITSIKGTDSPTSIDFIDINKFVSGSSSQNNLKIYDIQRGNLIQSIKYQARSEFNQSNKIIFDNKRRLIMSAHEDKYIRIFDPISNKCIKQIAAHSDSVTSLDLKSDTYELMSCGHDGSFRIWDLRKYRCINDIAIHMKKYDQSAICLTHSKHENIAAISGADGSVKFINSQS